MKITWQKLHHLAKTQAQAGQSLEMLATCQQINDAYSENPEALLSSGVLLLNFGYLSRASVCFEIVRKLIPHDLRPLVNLANLARESGDHAKSRSLYSLLAKSLPDQPLIRRNELVSLEYDPNVTANERLAKARAWGYWAILQAGGPRPRPSAASVKKRPLRIGYVSADFCQHTVSFLVKDVLKAHNPARVTLLAYSAGQVDDWLTEIIRDICIFRDVSDLNDAALAKQIEQDEVDILVDLSGHTAGSRLTMFAFRPAPIQVSWLGYFATTGLGYIDAILLDEWHAQPDAEAQFVEPIIRLPMGRLCYQPVPWAPAEIAQAPCLNSGKITFGCFNNSAKLNDNVYDLWAQILHDVPESLLVLKWRTFVDEDLSVAIRESFSQRGISPDRIELRGASFHEELLEQYADIDIALDPFPFTGGLTSCEALWMGVPVITFPQSQVVSRQTFALLSVIGLPELAAYTGKDYVRIAVELAQDKTRITLLRNGMRARMLASPLMNVVSFACQLENCFDQLYATITAN